MRGEKRMPTVSVILTSYNHEKYLQSSIDSVLAQTYTDFELVIVDDASTDRSWEIIESYQDPRIVKIRHAENLLFYANHTIQNLTRGAYIAILHSDDIWEPEKLEQQVAFLDTHPECGATFSWARIIDEDGEPYLDETNYYFSIFSQPNRTRHEWLNFFFHNGNALCHPSVLIRRQCYEECGYYRDGLAQLPDLDMWMRVCLKYDIFVIPQKLLRFRLRRHEANSSGNRRDTRIRYDTEFYQLLDNYILTLSFYELTLIFPAVGRYDRAELSNVRFAFAMYCLSAQGHQSAKAYAINLLFALMRDPATREVLQSSYGFTHREFLKITGEQEQFLLEAVRENEQQIAALHSELAAVYSSKKWRFGLKIAKLIRIFK